MIDEMAGPSPRADAVPSRVMVAAAIATLWLLGGFVYPLLTLASEDLSAMQLTALRTSGAVVMTTPLLIYRMRGRLLHMLSARVLGPNIVAGLTFYPLGNGLLTFASARLPSSLTALVFSLLPVLAATVSAVRGVRLGRVVWIGILGALACMILVVGAPGAAVALAPLAAALASVVCWYSGTEYWAARGLKIDLIASVWLQLVVGSLGCWISLALTGTDAPSLSTAWQPIVVLLAFSQFISHAAYLSIAGRVSPVVLTSFAFVNPVVAAFAGYLLLSQTLTGAQLLASAGLLAAVAMVVRAPRPRRREREAGSD